MPLTSMLAPDYETYIHRIGRTGRFGRSGIAINFVRDERDMTTIHAFEKYFRESYERTYAHAKCCTEEHF